MLNASSSFINRPSHADSRRILATYRGASPAGWRHGHGGFRRLLAAAPGILDDLGLRHPSAGQAVAVCELIAEFRRRDPTVVTDDRTIDEWIGLLDDPILAESSSDRFALTDLPIHGPISHRSGRLTSHRADTVEAPGRAELRVFD